MNASGPSQDAAPSGLTELLVDKGAITRETPDSTGRILYRAFGDIGRHFDDHHAVHRYLYSGIPIFRSSINLDNVEAFDYCCNRRYFVLICPYTERRELLVERIFTDSELSWSLCGGSVRRDLAESFVDSASRHANGILPGIELGEIEPIAFFENTFHYQGNEHIHLGIGFVGRIRNLDLSSRLRRAVGSRAHIIDSHNSLPPFSLTHNKKMVELAVDHVSKINFDLSPEDEVAENLKYQTRYRLHDKLVKPVLRRASHHIFEYSLDELDQRIHLYIAEYANQGVFLDVACGDNSLIFDLAKSDTFSLLVGNDVSWSQVQLLNSRKQQVASLRDHASFTLFSNHDARRLPFPSDKFEVAFCKNVLHHMDSLQSVRSLLDELLRVSKAAIVVEVMDPAMESRWGKMRHRYYMQFLQDAGEHFLSRREFEELTDRSSRVILEEMQTIRGIYLFAVFRKEGNA